MDTELARLQSLFWRTARGHLDQPAVRREFCPQGELGPLQRMAIYRDMYFARQIDVLAELFPVVRRTLGAEAFGALAYAYLGTEPSRQPAIEWIGERLPEYMRRVGQPADVCELAGLEWQACRALLAPDDAIARASDVEAQRWPDASLRLARSLSVSVVTRVAYQRYAGQSDPAADGGDVLASDSAAADPRVHVAIWRRRFAVRHLALRQDEARALSRARAGASVAALCATLGSVERAHEVLLAWFAREWISQLEVMQ